MAHPERMLTVTEAYEAAYRFVSQYTDRERDSEALQLMLVSMRPVDDYAMTNDPASWEDWLKCVADAGKGPSPRPGPPLSCRRQPGPHAGERRYSRHD